jgi:hypothetical protein
LFIPGDGDDNNYGETGMNDGKMVFIDCAVLLGIALLLPLAAAAAWPSSPLVNVPLCTAVRDQFMPTTTPDGAGGAIVTWYDYRSSNANADIYVQRVSASGTPMWGPDGVVLCAALENQVSPVITSDGAGGAIVAWNDFRTGTSWDVYAQRVSAGGAVMWGPDGVGLCVASEHQLVNAITADGAGGAIIAWHDRRAGYGNDDIYVQRISAGGALQWAADGTALCTAVGNQQLPTLIPDGVGGAIVTWQDARDYPFNWFICAQKISAAGAVQWAADGVIISTTTNEQTYPTIVSDGAGGAIVTWMDYRRGFANTFAQRISSGGTVQWAANGVAVCVAAGYQYYPQITSDGVGGAIITWADYRFSNWDIYAQRISAAGALLWAAPGLIICPYYDNQEFPTIVGDGAGGAIITWMDQRDTPGISNIFAQRISALGAAQWTPYGVALCTATGSQAYPTIVTDGVGGAIVTWYDDRNGRTDIYAQRVQANGQLGGFVAGVPEAAVLSLRNFPNPFNPRTTISFDLPTAGTVRLEVFDAAGRLVRTLVDESMPQGSHEAAWDGWDASGRNVGSGIYLARLQFAGKVEMVRMGLVR